MSVSNQQTLTLQQAIDLAIQHHNAGQLPEAEKIYQKILQANPNQPVALHLLGVIAHQVGNNDVAVELIEKALRIKPDFAAAHNNLGSALRGQGQLQGAAASFRKALTIKSDYADAHYNLGNVLLDQRMLEDAGASYRKALTIKPDFADAHYNLANTLRDQGMLEDAVASYRKVITFRPGFAAAHNNLGNVLLDQGMLDDAVASFHKALAIKPDYVEVWNNLKTCTKARQFLQAPGDGAKNHPEIGISDAARATVDFAFLEYFLDSFQPHKLDENVKKVLAALPSRTDETIAVNDIDFGSAKPARLPNRLIALLHFGRSGTGLLHSLIDGHPEISTLPSIYLRGYFNAGVWNRLSAEGFRRLPERFADEFAVLFDSNSPESHPGGGAENPSYLGKSEGMTCVGENRNEALSLSRDRFCAECHRLIKGLDNIDPKSFLMVVHAAYEKVIGTKTRKQTVFYHIHNPDDFAKLNFLRYAPEARLVMMIREPVESCESWIRTPFDENAHPRMVYRIITMLFAIDQIVFRAQASVGVRLEDLKTRPKETIRALCAWMGVKEAASLYQMTAQGKKWWGDPSSPNYDVNTAMPAFATAPSQRPVGSVFSAQDQFILRTLFYPFRVRFAYQTPNPEQFQKDLKAIRPLLDEMLDFEKTIAERADIAPAQLKKTVAYQFFRAGLVDRWQVLKEIGDYPHMLQPLPIS